LRQRSSLNQKDSCGVTKRGPANMPRLLVSPLAGKPVAFGES
jgi:hypothetical protein